MFDLPKWVIACLDCRISNIQKPTSLASIYNWIHCNSVDALNCFALLKILQMALYSSCALFAPSVPNVDHLAVKRIDSSGSLEAESGLTLIVTDGPYSRVNLL